jgi:hypothetical protein
VTEWESGTSAVWEEGVELSTKAKLGEAFHFSEEVKAFPLSTGVDLSAEQLIKTKAALGFFSGAPQVA